jgi:hypothetical protein
MRCALYTVRIRVFYYLRTMQEPAPVELLDE